MTPFTRFDAFDEIMGSFREANRPVYEYGDYSLVEMLAINDKLFEPQTPVQFHMFGSDIEEQVPLCKLTRYFLQQVNITGKIKLTVAGYLPLSLVNDIYSKQFIPDFWNEFVLKFRKNGKLRESEVSSIFFVDILCRNSGYTNRDTKKLSLTEKGAELLKKPSAFFVQDVIKNAISNVSWSWFDDFTPLPIGQVGFGYILSLVGRFGADWRPQSFYIDKYFRAFPMLDYSNPNIKNEVLEILEEFDEQDEFERIDNMDDAELVMDIKGSYDCFGYRVFDVFLRNLNLVEFSPSENEDDFGIMIRKSPVFDAIFKVLPPIELEVDKIIEPK